MQHDVSKAEKERHLIMLSQGFNEVYPENNIMFIFNISKAVII